MEIFQWNTSADLHLNKIKKKKYVWQHARWNARNNKKVKEWYRILKNDEQSRVYFFSVHVTNIILLFDFGVNRVLLHFLYSFKNIARHNTKISF